jgi:hypothetical protein
MGNHPMGSGADPNPRFMSERLVDPAALNMGNTAENLHDRFPSITKDRTDAYAVASQAKFDAARRNGRIQPDLVPVATLKPGQGWTLNTVDEPPRPQTWRRSAPRSVRTGALRQEMPRDSMTAPPPPSWHPPMPLPNWDCRSGCGWSVTPMPGLNPR